MSYTEKLIKNNFIITVLNKEDGFCSKQII